MSLLEPMDGLSAEESEFVDVVASGLTMRFALSFETSNIQMSTPRYLLIR